MRNIAHSHRPKSVGALTSSPFAGKFPVSAERIAFANRQITLGRTDCTLGSVGVGGVRRRLDIFPRCRVRRTDAAAAAQ
jgi:hypothetical protein